MYSKVYPIKVTVPQDFPSPENQGQDVGKNWRSENVVALSLFKSVEGGYE